MKNEKEKEKEKKEKCGDLLQLIGGKQTASERFFVLGQKGIGSYGNGTPTQADAIWNHGTDRKHILGPLQLLPNLLEWKSHCDARAVPGLGQRTL